MVTASSSIFRDLPTYPDSSARRAQPTIYVGPPTSQRPSTNEADMLAILDAPLEPRETSHLGFQRKERELGAIFTKLRVFEARALQTRLANPKQGDELASKFARLTSERRQRLISFLADARRREAIAQGARCP